MFIQSENTTTLEALVVKKLNSGFNEPNYLLQPERGHQILARDPKDGMREGDILDLQGEWFNDPKYGYVFEVAGMTVKAPALEMAPPSLSLPSKEPQKGQETIDVIVKSIKFHDASTGYTIAKVHPENQPSRWITAKGPMGKLHEDEKLKLTGTRGYHEKYGPQFEVSTIELPDLREGGIDVFLKSGYLKGVGPAFGGRIYEKFGDESLDILDESPKKLLEVKGIGESKLKEIKQSWIETRSRREALSFFSQWNIGPSYIKKILDRWPNVRDAIQKVKDNPFILAWEIKGVGFKLADKIASSMQIPQDAKVRTEAAIGYTLDQAASVQGHCYLPKQELVERVADFLLPEMKNSHSEVTFEKVEHCLEVLSFEQKVVVEGGNVYLKNIYMTEGRLANHIKRLLNFKISVDIDEVAKAIADFEQGNGFPLHANQRNAVMMAATQKVAIITGGPGTGKTTIIKCLLHVCTKLKFGKMALAAPTGKAAQRMAESCGCEASTIHRLLGYGHGGMTHNEKSPLKVAGLICDESSMISLFLGKDLCCALADAARLIFVGDVNQLPPVGAGTVLKDLIKSKVVPVEYLTKVYRQNPNSYIALNAETVLRGNPKALKLKRKGDGQEINDSFLMAIPEKDSAGEEGRDLTTEEKGGIARRCLKKALSRLLALGREPKDIMVLSPAKQGGIGVFALNDFMQGQLNPNGMKVGRTDFRVGDRVMQTRNNYDKEVYNGDQGYIVEYVQDAETIMIDYEGRSVEYKLEELDEISLAYVITVHKAQGMESPCVIQFVSKSHYTMLKRSILYTGMTRAKNLCLLVGEIAAINMAVKNNTESKRYTNLAMRLRTA